MFETVVTTMGVFGLGTLVLLFVLEKILRIQYSHYIYDVLNCFAMAMVGSLFLWASAVAVTEPITANVMWAVIGYLILLGVFLKWTTTSNAEFKKPVLYFVIMGAGALLFLAAGIIFIFSVADTLSLSLFVGIIGLGLSLITYIWWPIASPSAKRRPLLHFVLMLSGLAILVVYVLMLLA
jgi:uncharacterized membrane protein